MNDKFLFGVILGMLGGAVLVTNSNKMRNVVKDGQDQVVSKVSEITKKSKQKE